LCILLHISDNIVYFASYFRQYFVFCFIFQTKLCFLLNFQTSLCILCLSCQFQLRC
jgi:hypothetical protein